MGKGRAIRLVKLEVEPELRGQGLGSRALRALKAKYDRIDLVAYPDDPNRYEDCRRFYARAGFTEEGAGDFFWSR
jgi:GNAT superfamily N-acetyltransferase